MSLRPFKMHNKSNNLWNARQILPMWKVKSMEISMKKLTTTHVMYRIFREWRPSKFCVLRLDMREQRGVGSRDRLHSRHPHLRYNIFKYTNIFSQPNKPMHTFHHLDSHSLTWEVFIKTKTHREIIYLSYSLPQFWTIPVNISVTCGVSRFTIGRAWRPSRQQWLKLEEGNCIWRKVILNS